jgi:hypothetical protein
MLDPEVEDVVITGAWLVAGAASLWCWVPILLHVLIGTGYENGGAEDTTATEPDGSDPDYTEVHAVLTELGYEPLGAGFMRLFFYRWSWRVRTRVRAFRSRATKRFAFVTNGSFPNHRYNHVFFATCWADGGSLLTTSWSVKFLHVNGPDVTNLCPTASVIALERHHAAAVSEMEAQGRAADADMSLNHLLSVTRSRAQRVRGQGRKALFSFALSWLIVQGLVTGIAVHRSGWWNLAPALTCIVALVLIRLIDLNAQLAHARALRQQVQRDRGTGPRGGDDWGDTE